MGGDSIDGLNGAQLKKQTNGAVTYAPDMSQSADDMRDRVQHHDEAAAILTQMCGVLGESWKGAAADAARQHFEALRDVTTTASSGVMQPAGSAFQMEAEDHTNANHQMTDMPDSPDHVNSVLNGAAKISTLGMVDPQHDKNDEWNGKNEHNIRVYKAYSSASTANEQPLSNPLPPVKLPSGDISGNDHHAQSVGNMDQSSSNLSGAGQTAPSGAHAGTSGAGSSSGGVSGGSGSGGSSAGGSHDGGSAGGGSVGGAPSASGRGDHQFTMPHGNSPIGSHGKPDTPDTFKPSAPSADGFTPSSDDLPAGGTSSAGYSGASPADVGGFGPTGGTSGFGSGGSSQSGGAGGAAGMGMMPPPMMGGAGMGAGGGDQIRSGGGYGAGLNEGGPGSGARSGVGGFGPQGSGTTGSSSPASTARGGMGGPMGAGAGRGKGEDDKDHEDDYYMKSEMDVGLTQTDEQGEVVVDPATGMVVPPSVIGDVD